MNKLRATEMQRRRLPKCSDKEAREAFEGETLEMLTKGAIDITAGVRAYLASPAAKVDADEFNRWWDVYAARLKAGR